VRDLEGRRHRVGGHRLEDRDLSTSAAPRGVLYAARPLEVVRAGAIAEHEEILPKPARVAEAADAFDRSLDPVRGIGVVEEIRLKLDRRDSFGTSDERGFDRDSMVDIDRVGPHRTRTAGALRLDRDRETPVAASAGHHDLD